MQHNFTEDLLTSVEKANIITTVESLLGDADLSASLIYEQYDSVTFTASTQEMTETWNRTVCNGVKGKFRYDEIIAGGGNIELDDAFFIIPQTSLAVPQEKEDRILEWMYDAGTLNVAASSTSVVRYDATPDWDIAHAGDVLKIGNDYLDVKESAEATLTLLSIYTGSTATNQGYELYRRWKIKRVEQDLLEIIWKFQARSI